MLKFWYKEFPQFPQENPDYWRARLIQHALLIGTVFFSLLALINLFYFHAYSLALLDSVGFCLTLAIYAWFRRSANVNLAAWAFALLATALVSWFVIMVEGRSHSLMWATLIPPFTFFLLGRQWGSVLSAIVFSVCALVVYQQVQTQVAVTFTVGSLLNVIEVAIAHLLIFRFYERSRSTAYQHLAGKTEQIRKLAETDSLTGLHNREKLDRELEQIFTDALQHEDGFSLMLLDLDHFKQINDQFGHLEGDKVLAELSDSLRTHMRQQDLLARWGGEEFVVVLPKTGIDNAAELAERLRSRIAATSIHGHHLTISIGVAQYQAGDTIPLLLERTDQALYEAKHKGRNRVVVR
ncbi:GGDEF domain-containing protein [Lacimicrobium sp. SS2-24]|uniref:GGDEF domain-containing protein n=1 Tax=Lacimicrobium sp. SS2-24 TaxID=2005569 RepID=UPI000B4B3407|nr:GGDEF domain-containing protein [Lacimicrobium sp. SS2-24]